MITMKKLKVSVKTWYLWNIFIGKSPGSLNYFPVKYYTTGKNSCDLDSNVVIHNWMTRRQCFSNFH